MASNPVARTARNATWRLPLVAAAALIIGSGCGIPLTAPSGTAITLVASRNVVPLDGFADITAVLIEGGQGSGDAGAVNAGVGTPVHNGTVVSFVTTLGRIEPAEAKTTNGRATVRFYADAGQSGVATITAFSGGASQTLELPVGAAAGARIILTALPNTLPPGGGTTTLEARVEDQQGNGLGGIPVTFAATAGTLASRTATTDSHGVAGTSLSTSTASTVTASAGGAEGTLTATADITIGSQLVISITPPTGTIAVSTPATFAVRVTSSGSDTVILTDTVIDFGEGEVPIGTLVSGADAVSVVHVFASPGVATVTVSGLDSQGRTVSRSTQVGVTQLQASLTCSTPAAGGRTTTCAATVTPGTALVDHYEWDFGDGFTPSTASANVQHTYGSAGTWIIQVRIVPVRGAPVTASVQLILT